MNLPPRKGPRPHTTPSAPHIQLDQNAPAEMQAALRARVYALADVEERQTTVSDPRARAIWLKSTAPDKPPEGVQAFLNSREIGHFHPWDGSLHIALPPDVARAAVEAGWAEPHPMALMGAVPESIVMLYGPRDEHELEVVYDLIVAAVRNAGGRGPKEAAKGPSSRQNANS